MSQTGRSLSEFLEALASREPTPGGGSASALVGAIAAALVGMVGRLNDKKDGAAGPLHETIARADALRTLLSALVDEDIAAFNALAASWKVPDGPEYAASKQAAVLRATRSPLEIMERSLEVMRLAEEGLRKSRKNCLSDAGVAAVMAHAALEGARLNVMINLPGISDERLRQDFKDRAGHLCDEAAALRVSVNRSLDEHYAR